ncbi:MAG: helix-turn-helix transcriptional regulator [Gemmatimonadota bacterium]|nr:helix-turn-helix transcriptional regulator [Gemmatimonadota bacterium]
MDIQNGQAEDSATIDRAWTDDAAGETVPGEVVRGILEGGSPLRVWRKYRGLTLASLAGSVGVSRGYLSQIENGHKSGTLDLFRRLSGALDVSMDQLVEPVSDAVTDRNGSDATRSSTVTSPTEGQ